MEIKPDEPYAKTMEDPVLSVDIDMGVEVRKDVLIQGSQSPSQDAGVHGIARVISETVVRMRPPLGKTNFQSSDNIA